MRENREQKNSEYGHFSRSECFNFFPTSSQKFDPNIVFDQSDELMHDESMS